MSTDFEGISGFFGEKGNFNHGKRRERRETSKVTLLGQKLFFRLE